MDVRLRDIVKLRFSARAHVDSPAVEREVNLIAVSDICEHVNSYKLSEDQEAA